MTEEGIRRLFGNPAVDALRAQIDAGASPQIDVDELIAVIASQAPWVDVQALLQAAADASWLRRVETMRCEECQHHLDPDDIARGDCPYCNADFSETSPIEAVIFQSLGPLSRSTPWLVAIHGFNTTGSWQELFSWLIATTYRYRAPVFIYKYGILRVGVLFRWRHKQLARILGGRIRAAMFHAERNGIIEPPDVIIHSFGSQLFRVILELDEFADLKFGRVIAIGSVIRPDFDWSRVVTEGRCEAVLNQCGGRDRAVPWAQYTIPDSGPAGRYGFSDPVVINVMSPRYGHSSAFDEPNLLTNLGYDGIYASFLRLPLSSFVPPGKFTPAPWKPSPTLLRLLSRLFVIASGVAALAGLLALAT